MAFNIGELVGYVKIDHSGARTGMQSAEREVKAGMDRTGAAAEKGGKDVGGKFTKGVTGATSTGLKMLGGAVVAGFAIDKVVGFLGDATQAASDFQQTAMKSKVIFGAQADAMDKWASNSVDAFGLSKTAALDAAAGFGDMLLQLGDSGDEAAKTSQQVVQLAADLGSFNNVETGDVLDRISASLRGEYDSLQALIPNINAARVEQEAMAETGKKNASSLTAQEKAHATLAIIQKDGSRAQGDFARSAGTFAIEQQKATAKSQELQVQIGEKLLPIMTAFQSLIANQILPAVSTFVGLLSSIGGAIGDIPGPVKAAVGALVAFHLLKGPLSSMLDTVRLKAMGAGDALKGMGKGGGLKGSLTGLVGLINPWTAAITGATFALGAYAQANANAQADVDSLTETLDKQTGAFTKATREFVGKNFSFNVAKEDVDRLEQVGIKLSDVTDAALGTDKQFESMRDRLLEIANGNSDATQSASGLLSALENMRDKTKEARDQAEVHAKALGETSSAATDATAPVKEYANETERLKTKSAGAAQKQKDLRDAMLGVIDAATSADSAAIDYQKALDDATASAKENGKTLDIGSEKGRNNKQSLLDLAAAAKSQAEEFLNSGKSVDSVKKSMQDSRESFIEAARKMGASKKAAEEMADKYGITKGYVDNLKGSMDKIPAEVVSKLKVEKAAAEKQLATFKKYLSGNWDKTVTITAVYQAVGSAAALRVANERKMGANGLNPNLRFGGPIPGYALGGGRIVGAGSDTSDSILGWVAETGRAIRVSRDEFVSNASSRRRNAAALEAGNKGAMLGVVGAGSSQSGPLELSDRSLRRLAYHLSRVRIVTDVDAVSAGMVGGMS